MDKVPGDSPLSLAEVAVLRVIAEAEPCRVKDVEHSLHLASGVARRLLGQLEEAGHCTRHRNAGMLGLVSLTESGQAALAQYHTTQF